jgi:nucleotide-binding universal stress UspA family protein
VREGFPAQQIVAAARQFQADRVLLGTRSRSKLSKLLAGSVAEQVLRSVYIPVMTVGPEAHLLVAPEHDQKTVLHATTLRETSRPSAALACRIAAQQGAKLVLLHVISPKSGNSLRPGAELKEIEDSRNASIAEELRQLAAQMRSEYCGSVESVVIQGNPIIEILAKADELNAGMIVLGATDRSALGNLARDRTIYRVLAHARCPVLTLREGAGEPAQTHAELAEVLHH